MTAGGREPAILRAVAGSGRDALVFQTRTGSALGATRYFLRPAELGLEGAIARRVLAGGPATGLGGALIEAVEGYRVRAALGSLPGLPAITGAGLARSIPPGMPALAAAYGYPYVTSEWIEGSSLTVADARLPAADRLAILSDLLAALAALHARGVALGRIDASAVSIAGDRGWWLRLGGLRELGGGAREEIHASEVAAFARLAAGVLAIDPAGEEPAWRRWSASIEACLTAAAPAPSAADLAGVLGLPEPAAGHPETAARDTIVVSDGPLAAASPTPGADSTVFVPDAVDFRPDRGATSGPHAGEEQRGRPSVAVAIAAVALALALAIAALWIRG